MQMKKTATPRKRGALLVVVAIIIPALFIFAGFAVDLANMQRTRSELRIATDLAAKAAADALSRTGDTSQAVLAGQAVASANPVAGVGLTLQTSDFVFGQCARLSSGKWSFTPASNDQNGVRITGNRTQGSANGPVNLFFGSLIGKSSFEPTTQSTAAFLNVDVCLVLDRSSSMKMSLAETGGLPASDNRWCAAPNGSARWRDLDSAVRTFIGDLNASVSVEHLAMVTFGGPLGSGISDCGGNADHSIVSVDVDLTPTYSTIENALTARMNSVWNGNTDIARGIQEGISVLLNSRPSAMRVMILLTDGEYTEADPVPWASAAANNDITIHTITFGGASSATWIGDMQTIALNTGGKHMHAPKAQDLNDTFRDLAASITALIE